MVDVRGGATFLRKNGPKKKIFFLAKIIFFWCIHSICRVDTSKYLFRRCLCKSWGKLAKYFWRYGLSKLPPQEVILRCHFFWFFLCAFLFLRTNFGFWLLSKPKIIIIRHSHGLSDFGSKETFKKTSKNAKKNHLKKAENQLFHVSSQKYVWTTYFSSLPLL